MNIRVLPAGVHVPQVPCWCSSEATDGQVDWEVQWTYMYAVVEIPS